jgi:hypothetical protein
MKTRFARSPAVAHPTLVLVSQEMVHAALTPVADHLATT